MDEEDEKRWLTGTNGPYIAGLVRFDSDRKLRLVACALCRVIWVQLSVLAKEAVEVAEGYADGNVNSETREKYYSWLKDAGGRDSRRIGKWLPSCAVSECGWYAAELGVGSGIEPKIEVAVLHDIFGNPYRPVTFNPSWRTSDVLALARGIYDERAFDRMPILADALQDAGCDNEDVLFHCRDAGATHYRGCWVVDGVLGLQ